jgi:hypothetical protein
MKRSIGIAAIAAATLAGCGGNTSLTGEARMSLKKVPSNVQCITLKAAADRTVEQSFPVTPGQPSTLSFTAIPTGQVTFSGLAYAVACSALSGATPTWTSEPTTVDVMAGTPVDVHLVFHATSDATIEIDFDDGTPASCDQPSWPNRQTLVARQILVPLQRTDYAYDLNGDGHLDNQYGNIVGALAAQGIDSQARLNAAVASGDALVLIEGASNDPAFTNDTCAAATVRAGVKPATPPRFDGSDVFTVDSQIAPAKFTGPIVSQQFASPSPATMTQPISASLLLPFGAALVRVPLIGARLSVDYLGGPPEMTLTRGQINGAVRASDVETKVIPAIAQSLNDVVAADPTSSTAQQILSLFDTGGTADMACGATCRNPDGSCAAAGDQIISICELSSSALIKNLLAPDVQMFAADGSYQPNPANTVKDSFSVGLHVSLVPATF